MSWVRVAFGLIREAVATEEGREVIKNVRSAVRRDPADTSAPSVDVQALLERQRAEIDGNMDRIVQTLNAQNQRYSQVIRRLQLWNIGLTAGLLVLFLLWIFVR